MNLDYLIPIAKSHAIQSVVFALEWQGELTDHALTEIQKLAPELKSHFPEAAVQKVVKINIGPRFNNTQSDQQVGGDQLGGMTFQRKGKFGNVVSQLNVSRSNFLIIINEYDRWAPTLEVVMRYIKIVLPAILKEKSISIIALQYTDMFTWKDNPENLNLREVFTDNSPYLAPNVFDQKGLWHCHHGYVIQQLADDLDGSCLDNVNVNTVDNLGDREIHITTTHKFTLNSPLRLATKTYLQSIRKVQDVLHVHNKDILRSLLTQEVCKKIHLVDKIGE
ncbi:TIGR04255 family protein [Nitrosomonas sp. Is37]|uniref:TIGR04255 family protein n=1 Tax=Nitrosomonas sp. Is37 TaxID=3080535 RepID=UPI00294B850E|nr:TIGR04255 family protein [Nitrosomonas sp. Is37]MDV6345087.1 TIGR04255 family protein [Nitrosomonas sp. Is37]